MDSELPRPGRPPRPCAAWWWDSRWWDETQSKRRHTAFKRSGAAGGIDEDCQKRTLRVASGPFFKEKDCRAAVPARASSRRQSSAWPGITMLLHAAVPAGKSSRQQELWRSSAAGWTLLQGPRHGMAATQSMRRELGLRSRAFMT